MDVKQRLRNNLIRRIQHLSAEKLAEIAHLLTNIESHFKSKDKTLKLSGSWSDLADDQVMDLTVGLHERRAKDRQID